MKAHGAHIEIEEPAVIIFDRHEHCLGVAFSLPAALNQLEEARNDSHIGWWEWHCLESDIRHAGLPEELTELDEAMERFDLEEIWPGRPENSSIWMHQLIEKLQP